MAMTKQIYKNDCIILSTIEELVEDLYSIGGRTSIPPVVLFKLLFINIIFVINSMRRTCEECKVNVAYRWFLGLSIYDDIPNYSTWSQNYIRRYKDSKVFNEIFDKILKQANENRYTQLWKDNYSLRKETIERTFGDCKEQHGLRFTRVRGLLKNEQNAKMIFACHNLKKMANWRWKLSSNISNISLIFSKFV